MGGDIQTKKVHVTFVRGRTNVRRALAEEGKRNFKIFKRVLQKFILKIGCNLLISLNLCTTTLYIFKNKEFHAIVLYFII